MWSVQRRSFAIPDQVVWEELGGEAVVMHVELNTCCVLNTTGARVWRNIAHGTSIEEIALGLSSQSRYEVTRALSDVASFVCQLTKMGLLGDTVVESSAASHSAAIRDAKGLSRTGLIASTLGSCRTGTRPSKPDLFPAPKIKLKVPIFWQPDRIDPRCGSGDPWQTLPKKRVPLPEKRH